MPGLTVGWVHAGSSGRWFATESDRCRGVVEHGARLRSCIDRRTRARCAGEGCPHRDLASVAGFAMGWIGVRHRSSTGLGLRCVGGNTRLDHGRGGGGISGGIRCSFRSSARGQGYREGEDCEVRGNVHGCGVAVQMQPDRRNKVSIGAATARTSIPRVVDNRRIHPSLSTLTVHWRASLHTHP
jgi:hypothetical protein